MAEMLRAQGVREQFRGSRLTRRWTAHVVLAAAVGLIYFLVAELAAFGLVLQPGSISVFWPSAGVSSAALIILGPRRWWPAVVGIAIAEILAAVIAPQAVWHIPWVIAAIALCDTVEPLIVAGLIAHFFGADFALDRLRKVVGLMVATVVGAVPSSLGAAVTLRLALGPSVPVLSTAGLWFASVFVGTIAVAPLLITISVALRHPSPPRGEWIEFSVALVALALVIAVTIFLPRSTWEILLPDAWSLPIVLWLAARLRPAFAAAGAFLVSISIVCTTVYGIGHFGDPSISEADRVLSAQAAILFVAISAYVFAAICAERRAVEARLAQSNAKLQRERDNKLLSAQAATAAVAHEIRQPLTAIAMSARTGLLRLARTPPNHDEVRATLVRIERDVHRASDVFDAIRTLFGKSGQERQPIDVNRIVLDAIDSLREELDDHGVTARYELSELPPVSGHETQLREVVWNLISNAVEAMSRTSNGDRTLSVRTEVRGRDEIVVSVQDSGPGIDVSLLENVFGSFVSTKSQGTGLGLAICRMIIEGHAGRITASSDGVRGAVFQFSLPIASTDTASDSS